MDAITIKCNVLNVYGLIFLLRYPTKKHGNSNSKKSNRFAYKIIIVKSGINYTKNIICDPRIIYAPSFDSSHIKLLALFCI